MAVRDSHATTAVIGGGFYGVNIALYMAKHKNKGGVVLLERENQLLSRASYNNQARVHNGYHYPRSFTTAYRSRINLPKFVHDWPEAVTTDFTKIYAIARKNSKVTAHQFQRFCHEIGAKIEPAGAHEKLFNPILIEKAFLVEEYAFDASSLAEWATQQLKLAGVEVIYGATVTDVNKSSSRGLSLTYQTESKSQHLTADNVFNCTYSGLNQLSGDVQGTHTKLKQEITEMALVKLPDQLRGLGVTVMDGPFFSVMPFPARGVHTLSHVRYTPHMSWPDENNVNPYEVLAAYHKQSRFNRMQRDAQRYMPALAECVHQDSLFEVKTILEKNEGDDGRPILFETDTNLPGFYAVLGGKIDNIFDVLERLDDVF